MISEHTAFRRSSRYSFPDEWPISETKARIDHRHSGESAP